MALKAVVEKDVFEAFSDDLKAEYKEKDGKYVLDAPEGFKSLTEFTTVHGALQKERTDHKKSKDKLALFGDLNPDDVSVQLARIPELEIAAAGKIDEKKIDDIVNTRIHAKLAPVERERDRLKVEVQTKDQTIVAFESKEKTRTIVDAVGKATRAAKVLNTAEEDALMLAERVFEVQEDGTVVTKDNVGVTPGLTPDLWLKDMTEKRPHWWAPSQGGGANNRGGGGNIVNNPFTREHWNLTEQGVIHKQDPAKADRYAKAAGTTVGGGMPPKK
jgi:hypothetical protein